MDIQHRIEALKAKIHDSASSELEVLESSKKLLLLQSKYGYHSSDSEARCWLDILSTSGLTSWQKYLLHLIADYHFCPMRYNESRVEFFGTSVQVRTAVDLYSVLKSRLQSFPGNDSYRKGIVYALVKSLPALNPSTPLLQGAKQIVSVKKRRVSRSFLSGVKRAKVLCFQSKKELPWK